MPRKTTVMGPDKIRKESGALILVVPFRSISDSLMNDRPLEIESGAFMFVPDVLKETVLKARNQKYQIRIVYDVGGPE